MTGYVVEFKEVDKEEEQRKAQRRMLLSEAEEEKEPESDESWQKVVRTQALSPSRVPSDFQLLMRLCFPAGKGH